MQFFWQTKTSRVNIVDCANSVLLCENLVDKLPLTTWQVGKVFSFSDMFFFSVLEDFCWRRDKFQLRVDGYKSLEAICFLQSSNMFEFSFWEGSEYQSHFQWPWSKIICFNKCSNYLFLHPSSRKQDLPRISAEIVIYPSSLSILKTVWGNMLGNFFGLSNQNYWSSVNRVVLLMVHSGGPKKVEVGKWQVNAQAKMKRKSQVKTLPRIKPQANQNTISTPTEINRWIISNDQ